MNSQTPSFGLVCPVPAVVNTWEMNQKMVALSVALFISLCLSNDFLNELNHLYLNVKPRFVHLVLFFPPTPYNTLAFPQVTNIYYKTIINTEPQYFLTPKNALPTNFSFNGRCAEHLMFLKKKIFAKTKFFICRLLTGIFFL